MLNFTTTGRFFPTAVRSVGAWPQINRTTVAVLAAMVLISALGKVVVKHERRQRYALFQHLMHHHELLQREQDRLLLERGQLLAQHQLSLNAQARLNMHLPRARIRLDLR